MLEYTVFLLQNVVSLFIFKEDTADLNLVVLYIAENKTSFLNFIDNEYDTYLSYIDTHLNVYICISTFIPATA